MKLDSLATYIEAKIICVGAQADIEILDAFASDLMSDVLTIGDHHPVLITGLSNLQTIRTAEMADIFVIVLARDKKATIEMIELATENEIAILETAYSLFKTCGILFQKGINPIF